MAFCVHCGQQMDDHAQFCPHCGKQQTKSATATPTSSVNDDGNFGWSVLGFCIPIVGLILYLIWKDEKPNNAHAAGTGALIGFIIGLVVGGFRAALFL